MSGSYSKKVEFLTNLEAEQCLLGSILIDPSVMNLVSSKITSKDFSQMRHSKIWEAMLDLWEKKAPIDLSTVGDYAANADSIAYLARLMEKVPTALHADYYADQVINSSRLRELNMMAGRIAAITYEERNADEAYDRVKVLLLESSQERKDSRLLTPAVQAELMRDFFKNRQNHGGISTGYHKLDELTGGFHKGDLVVIAGRTSTGKSTF